MRAAVGPHNQIFQAFPVGGPVREIEVGSSWQRLLSEASTDLVMIDVPDDTRTVVLFATTGNLDGIVATEVQAASSIKLRPGIWTLCTDRDEGLEYWIAVDPRDDSIETIDVTISEAAR